VGETGTGKELVARALHELSSQRRGAFEAINCAAIPRDLMASALFGHERGAFTGATSTVRGAFERAGDGTIFLDEVGDMPPDTQASLLRVLQERGFRRVGGETIIPVRARVISATNKNLQEAVAQGSFRADLFYRLQMYSLRIPPLRERREEIPALVEHFLEQHRGSRRQAATASARLVAALSDRELRGNARELESLVLGALVRARGANVLMPEHLPAEPAPGLQAEPIDPGGGVLPDPSDVPTYETMERQYIASVLRMTEGNKKEAAALMGIPRTTLNARIKKLGM
jgi:transcriptional regulator with PAS, ATPase and Fis domain